jgi:hypothetical protein
VNRSKFSSVSELPSSDSARHFQKFVICNYWSELNFWNLVISIRNSDILVKTQPMSDAVKRITAKFIYLFEGPFLVSKILDHSAYELRGEWGTARGKFNKNQLKQYKEEKGNKKGVVERIGTVTRRQVLRVKNPRQQEENKRKKTTVMLELESRAGSWCM